MNQTTHNNWRIRVRCSDGVARAGGFYSIADAEHWATWGHGCGCSGHTYEMTDRDGRNMLTRSGR